MFSWPYNYLLASQLPLGVIEKHVCSSQELLQSLEVTGKLKQIIPEAKMEKNQPLQRRHGSDQVCVGNAFSKKTTILISNLACSFPFVYVLVIYCIFIDWTYGKVESSCY